MDDCLQNPPGRRPPHPVRLCLLLALTLLVGFTAAARIGWAFAG